MKLPRPAQLATDTPTTHLLFLAGFSALVYLVVFTLPFPLTRFYVTIPPVDYAKLTGYSAGSFFAYVIGLAALFAVYLAAVRLAAPRPGPSAAIPIGLVFIASALLAATLFFSYPLTAIDLFIYAIRTRGWALYGLNPLTTAPEMLPRTDPWLGLAAEWAGAPSPYGPVWEWLSLAAFYLSGGSFLGHLLALKLLAALAYMGCAWLVYRILGQFQPAWAVAGTIAFAWNPLTLLESIQNGHNDILLAFFLLLAIWLLQRWPARESKIPPVLVGLAVCLGLALSILVKFITALVVPFFLLELAQRLAGHESAPMESMPGRTGKPLAGWLSVARTWANPRCWLWLVGYGLVTGLLVAGPMSFLWPGWDRWAVLEAGSGAGRSLLALLVLSLKEWLGTGRAFDVAHLLIDGIFLLIYLAWLWRFLTGSQAGSRSLPGLQPPLPVLPAFFVLFWYVLLVAPVFHAWYLLWFLPLASLLLPHRRPPLAAIVFSITGLLIIPYFETIRVWVPVLLENQWLGHLVGVPLLIGPPALALLGPIRPEPGSKV